MKLTSTYFQPAMLVLCCLIAAVVDCCADAPPSPSFTTSSNLVQAEHRSGFNNTRSLLESASKVINQLNSKAQSVRAILGQSSEPPTPATVQRPPDRISIWQIVVATLALLAALAAGLLIKPRTRNGA